MTKRRSIPSLLLKGVALGAAPGLEEGIGR